MAKPWEKYSGQQGPWAKYAPPQETATEPKPEPSLIDQIKAQAHKTLLTNEPTDNWMDKMTRGGPAAIGGAVGGTLGMVGGPLGSLAGAYVGGVGGEGLRQLAVNLEAMRQGKDLSAAESLGEIAGEGAAQATGQAAGMSVVGGARAAYDALRPRVAPAIRQLAGIPEAITEWAMKRGPRQILTSKNADPATALNSLDDLRAAVIGQKKEAGAALGRTEEAYLASPESQTMFDLRGPAAGVREELKRPIFDPVVSEYGGAAAEKGYLEKLAGDLESGPASGRGLMGLRKNLDKVPEWQGSPIPNPSTDLDRIVKGVNADLRGTINRASPAIGEANAAYEEAADLYARNQKMLGDTPKPAATNDADTIRRLRLRMENPRTQGAIERIDQDVAASLERSGSPKAPRPAPPAKPVGREDVIDAKMSFVDRLKALRQADIAKGPQEVVTQEGVPKDVFDRLTRIKNLVAEARNAGLRTSSVLSKKEMSLYRQFEEQVNLALKKDAPLKWVVEPEVRATASSLPAVTEGQIAAAARSAGRSTLNRPLAAEFGPPEAPLPPAKTVKDLTATGSETPARDLMDAFAAEAYYAPSDRMRSPSNLTLRILSAMGPTAMARYGLKAGQLGVEAGRTSLPYVKAGLPPAVAAALKKEREKKEKK